jgi:RNA polymerase sigma-70 factor, ECF subfamily
MRDSETELRALMLAGLAGDSVAHRTFLELLSHRFRTFFIRRLTHMNSRDAEDLVQEALIAIHTRRHGYDPGQPVTAWVFAIARYKLIDYFRRTKTFGVSIPIDDVADLFSAYEVDATDSVRDIETLLSRLPEKQGTVIRLVKLEDLSVREASARTGLSESNVKINIHRGMQRKAAREH